MAAFMNVNIQTIREYVRENKTLAEISTILKAAFPEVKRGLSERKK